MFKDYFWETSVSIVAACILTVYCGHLLKHRSSSAQILLLCRCVCPSVLCRCYVQLVCRYPPVVCGLKVSAQRTLFCFAKELKDMQKVWHLNRAPQRPEQSTIDSGKVNHQWNYCYRSQSWVVVVYVCLVNISGFRWSDTRYLFCNHHEGALQY